MARDRVVAGNWKMHGSRGSIAALLDELVKANPAACAVCVPFPYLARPNPPRAIVRPGAPVRPDHVHADGTVHHHHHAFGKYEL